MGHWGMYGYRYRSSFVPVATNTRVVEVERGTLVVDIIDSASNELVWRGTAKGITVSSDPAKTKRNAEKAILAMAKQARKLQARANR